MIVNLRNDLAAPTVMLASPRAGTIVNGTIAVATAVDAVAVLGVQFPLDGAPFGDVDTELPYEVTWSTVTASRSPWIQQTAAYHHGGCA